MKPGIVTVLALLLASCGGIAENLAENVAENVVERAIEADTGSSVDFDLDTSGGSVVMNVETDEGSQEMTFGSGEIPDGFAVPIPDSAVVQSVITAAGEGAFVTATVPASDFDSLVDLYTGFFAGFDDTITTSGPEQASWGSETAGAFVTVVVSAEEAILTATSGT